MRTLSLVSAFPGLVLWLCACAPGIPDATLPGALQSADATEAPADAAAAVADAPADAAGEVTVTPRYTYAVFVADTHFEDAGDSSDAHGQAMAKTFAALPHDLAGIFVAGDVTYTLPYATYDEYMADPNDRFDVAERVFKSWPAPVWPALGNHDYDFSSDRPMDLAPALFKHHFGTDPYYAADLGTWKVLVLDNFQGPTLDPSSPRYDYDSGSLGAEQTAWLESQLADGRPAVVMLHFPLFVVQGLADVLARHTDTVRLVVSGHSHAWLNLSDNYSVPHLVVGAATFDADSFLLLQMDNVLKTWRILNWADFHWGAAYTLPWSGD